MTMISKNRMKKIAILVSGSGTNMQNLIMECHNGRIPAQAKVGGRPRTTDLREVINAILYQNRTGCQYDMLPHDLPPIRYRYHLPKLNCENGDRRMSL